jgi:hypothetical protein
MTKKLLAGTMLVALSGSLIAARNDVKVSTAPTCQVQGVWNLIATLQAGKRTEFSGAVQQKVVTPKHFMWLSGASRRDTLPLRTPLDSANYYAMSGGAGTYSVSGHRYVEHIELFIDPKLEGKNLVASCRVAGNQWFHTYLPSDLESGANAAAMSRDSITEIFQRVE